MKGFFYLRGYAKMPWYDMREHFGGVMKNDNTKPTSPPMWPSCKSTHLYLLWCRYNHDEFVIILTTTNNMLGNNRTAFTKKATFSSKSWILFSLDHYHFLVNIMIINRVRECICKGHMYKGSENLRWPRRLIDYIRKLFPSLEFWGYE